MTIHCKRLLLYPLKSCIFIYPIDLPQLPLSKAVPRRLASHFPVIIVPNKQHSFLINLYQLTFNYPELNSLFEIKEPVSEEPVDPGPQAEKLPSQNGGRKSFTTLLYWQKKLRGSSNHRVSKPRKDVEKKLSPHAAFQLETSAHVHGQISLVEGTRN